MGLNLEQRRRWANRNGNPLWLWPEVDRADWSAALVEFEGAIRAILAGDAAPEMTGDPQALRLAAYTSGMGPMLGRWSEAGALPGGPIFASQLEANRARMKSLLAEAKALADRLVEAGIDVLVLKGAHTASYFPDPGCRPMSDIDLLVPAEQRTTADRSLLEAGFERIADGPLESCWRLEATATEPVTMISVEAGDPWTVDLHYSLDVEGPPGARPAKLSLLRPFSGARTWEGVHGAGCLGQPTLLLHLAAHAGSGFQNLTLLRLLELLLVIREDRKRGALDWDSFLSLGSATGALAFAFPALHLAQSLSPADVPQAVVAQCAHEAPAEIRRLTATLTPATAHRINRRSVREHYAWTQGFGGWVRRLGADLLPDHRSLRRSAAIHRARANAIFANYSAAGRRCP